MRPIRLASKHTSIAVACRVVCIASLVFFVRPDSFSVQTAPDSVVLDLTPRVPPGEEGYHGIPGAEAGGLTGPSSAIVNSAYRLPLRINILGSSTNSEGDFVIDVLVRNTSKSSFELPSSRNLTKIETAGNKSQRVFFFLLQPVAQGQTGQFIESAPVGGSSSVPGSFTRLGPGEALRVLLRAGPKQVRGAFKGEMKDIQVHVVCHEWQLEDDRFFIRARSAELSSENAINFVLRDDRPTLVQH